ncbi:MAG: MBL fold metallo-hydrolase, partial [Synergistaceae bacterium]|nr:MBL fold metallo-hydrolase [Synergistaceae bacterium]
MLDSLEILTLVENSAPMRGPFVAEHGLSFLLTARRGDRTVRGLLDVGKSPEVLEHNMKGLGVAPEDIDFLVLSHCHYDHTGGIARFVASTGKENFPVVAHPALFRPHFRADPVLTSIGIQTGDERESVEAAGGKFFLSSDPFPLTPGLVSLGEIPRSTDIEGPGGSFLTLDEGEAVPNSMPD